MLEQVVGGENKSADLLVSLFVAALQSYRYDSVLRPFPQIFLKENGEKDVKLLVSTCNLALHN